MRQENIHNCFADILIQKFSKYKNPKDIFNTLNLSDQFWIMHLNLNHFFAHIKNNQMNYDIDKIRDKINRVKIEILNHHSEIFEKDFLDYKLNLIDDIFSNISSIEQEISIADFKCEHRILKFFKELSEKIKDIQNNSNMLIEKFSVFIDIIKMESPFDIVAIRKLRKILEPRNIKIKFPNAYSDPKTFIKFKDRVKRIDNKISECIRLIEEKIISSKNDELKILIKVCRENKLYRLENYLVKLEYATDFSFNKEIILLFLFIDLDDLKDNNYLKIIIKRHEKLFCDIYEELKFASPNTRTLLDFSISCKVEDDIKPCVQLKKYIFDDNNLILFKLKKLISLYGFYCDIKNIHICSSIEITLRDFDFILKETKMMEIEYNPLLDNLPNYVLNTFGLSQKDLSQILDIHESGISRKLEDGSILEKYTWFWKAATDFSYTYMNGETTIPYYGKHEQESTKYLIAPVITMAFAEIFFKYITGLKEYKNALKSKNSTMQKELILSKEYLRKISAKSLRLVENIQSQRVAIDKLYEDYLIKKSYLFRYENEDNDNRFLKIKISDKEEAEKKFNDSFQDLLKKMEQCLEILQ